MSQNLKDLLHKVEHGGVISKDVLKGWIKKAIDEEAVEKNIISTSSLFEKFKRDMVSDWQGHIQSRTNWPKLGYVETFAWMTNHFNELCIDYKKSQELAEDRLREIYEGKWALKRHDVYCGEGFLGGGEFSLGQRIVSRISEQGKWVKFEDIEKLLK